MFSINVTKAGPIFEFKVGCCNLHVFKFGFDTGPTFDIFKQLMLLNVLFEIEV